MYKRFFEFLSTHQERTGKSKCNNYIHQDIDNYREYVYSILKVK